MEVTNIQLLLLVICLVGLAVVVLLVFGLIWWKTSLLRQHKVRNKFMDKVLLSKPDSKLCNWRDDYSGCTGSGSGERFLFYGVSTEQCMRLQCKHLI